MSRHCRTNDDLSWSDRIGQTAIIFLFTFALTALLLWMVN